MINEFEWNRMIDGKLYSPWKVGGDSWGKVHVAQKRFNESEFWHDRSALEELKKCFGKAGSDMVLTPPVYFDHGNRTFFGEHFYANTGLTILDENYVRFGDNVFLAPHVSIYTAGHPIAAEIRNTELEYAKPVTIGSNVWIGGNVVINPGVTIGDDVVIGSGAVVTKDIPSHVIAAGNPCRVIREITEKDRQYWKEQYHNYIENDGESFVSEFCDVFYVEDKNVVFVNWKKYCELEQYRAPLEWALKVIKEHKGCNYVADTRNGFEDNPLDTKWVAEYFMPKAKEYGCQMIYFIIDKENSLKEELEGQAKDSSGLMEFKYVYGIDEVI